MDRVQERRVRHLAKRGQYSSILPGKKIRVRPWKYARPHKGYGWFAGTNAWYSKYGISGWKIPKNPLYWFGNKRFVIVVVLLSLILTGIPLAQGPLFHDAPQQPPKRLDPTQIWTMVGDSNLKEFNSILAGYNPAIWGTTALQLTSNSTNTAIALTKTPISSISQVANKNLWILFPWGDSANNGNGVWGWYLTTNSTLPSGGNVKQYDPRNDQSVFFVESINNGGVTVFTSRQESAGSVFSQDNGKCGASGSCWMNVPSALTPSGNAQPENNQLYLNYSGTGTGTCNGLGYGPGCSAMNWGSHPAQINFGQVVVPWLSYEKSNIYIGFFLTWGASHTVYFQFNGGNSNCNTAFFCIAPPNLAAGPTPPDTGGFFGPVIRALITIGVFVLQAILQFVGFIAPALESFLVFLESIVVTALNQIGVAFGFPASPGLGDDISTFINSVITLFTVQVPNAFGQIGPIFNGWINSLVIVFTTGVIGQIFAFLSSILTFGANIIVFAFGLFTTGLQWTTLTAPFWLFIWFFAFNADEGMNGWIRWFEFAKWLAFDIGVKFVTNVINWTIDVITAAMALLPKPFVQIAGKFPRLPIIEIHGVFSVPDFNGRAIREGNLFSILGMMFGFIGFVWYELTQTSIPGTLANQFSTQPWVQTASTAITFYKLFLPMGVLVVFLLMIPTLFTSIFGVVVPGPSVGFPKVRGTGPSRSFSVTGGSGRLFRARAPGRRSQAFIEKRLAKSEEQKNTRLRNQREEEAREKAENERLSRQQEQEEARKLEAQRGREAQESVKRNEAAKQKALEEQWLTAERRIRSEEERFT